GVGADRLPLPEIERADVVEPHDVIGVRMRVEEEVEPRDRRAQQLQAQIRRGVDQEVLPVRLDLHRLPQPLVARIVRRADGTMATDDRNAGGSAGAEERDDHTVTNSYAPLARSMAIASPVSYQGGRIVTVAGPAGMVFFSWKCPRITSVTPLRAARLRPYASIRSMGSVDLCLK